MLKNKKSVFLLTALVLGILFPMNTAFAHSTLEEATPKNGEELENTINRIELTFSTKVENGSTLYLVNDEREEIKPESIEINNDVLAASFEDSLSPGSYQVNWKIIGADGHLIENQYSFTIAENEDIASPTEDDQNSTGKDNNPQNGQETATAQNNQQTQQQNSSGQQTSNDQSFVGESGVIVLLIIAGLGLVTWLFFGKRKT